MNLRVKGTNSLTVGAVAEPGCPGSDTSQSFKRRKEVKKMVSRLQ